MKSDTSIEKWKRSAEAWIRDQGEEGDHSRQRILDPALEDLFRDVKGKSVLDLGCGEGRYSRILKQKGAVVSGIDPVPRFIEKARSLDPDSIYLEAFAEALPFEDASFDVVLSYLTVIDIPDLLAASREVGRVLRPGGELVVVNISNLTSSTPEWTRDENGTKLYRKVDRYMDHFSMELEWRDIRIRNYHRPLSYLLGLFLNQGFVLTRFLEPLPAEEDPGYEEEARVPNFQIYTLRHVAS